MITRCLNHGCHADRREDSSFCSALCREEHRHDLAQQRRDASAPVDCHAHTLFATASIARHVNRWSRITLGSEADLHDDEPLVCDAPDCTACRRRLAPAAVPRSERETVRPRGVEAA